MIPGMTQRIHRAPIVRDADGRALGKVFVSDGDYPATPGAHIVLVYDLNVNAEADLALVLCVDDAPIATSNHEHVDSGRQIVQFHFPGGIKIRRDQTYGLKLISASHDHIELEHLE